MLTQSFEEDFDLDWRHFAESRQTWQRIKRCDSSAVSDVRRQTINSSDWLAPFHTWYDISDITRDESDFSPFSFRGCPLQLLLCFPSQSLFLVRTSSACSVAYTATPWRSRTATFIRFRLVNGNFFAAFWKIFTFASLMKKIITIFLLFHIKTPKNRYQNKISTDISMKHWNMSNTV